jgi:DNA-binding beta-propeller fold protein YncE
MRQFGAALGLVLVLSAALPRPAAADSIERTWTVGEEPFGLAVDPSDGRIFVANSKYPSTGEIVPGSISVINPNSGQRSVIVTSGPADLVALDLIHRRLYSSNADHSLQVFDLDTLGPIARLPVGGLGLVVDAATQRAYVLDRTSAGSFLSVVDGTTNTVIQTKFAPGPELWWGLALDASLHRLYVTNINADPYSVPKIDPSLVVLDDRDLSLIADMPFPVITRFALAIDEARHRVYLGGFDPTLQFANSRFYALDGQTLDVLASTSIPGFPGGIAVAQALHRVYVTSPGYGGGGYRVLDDQTYEVVQTMSTAPYDPYLPLLHPDGGLYFGAWDRSGFDLLMSVHIGNSPPVISSATFTPPTPTTSDLLQFVVVANDGDLPDLTGRPGSVTYAYEWWKNGVAIAGASGSALDLSQPGMGDRGDTITARVTVSDAGGLTATATASVLIPNAAPAVTVTFDNTAPRTNDILTAIVAASDADRDPVTLIYQWYRNGARIAGASATTLDLATYGDRGDLIVVNVTASDDQGGVRQATPQRRSSIRRPQPR